MSEVSLVNYYDMLVKDGDDPVHDNKVLKEYMDKWHGPKFIKALKVDKSKSVLEIGAGTGRMAVQIIQSCGFYTGIDVSPKAVICLNNNLSRHFNKELICDDFLKHKFMDKFDIIYSTLTFFHIQDKRHAILKISNLLKANGRFVLSISKDNSDEIIYNGRKLVLFPDNMQNIKNIIVYSGLTINDIAETEFAFIFICDKFYGPIDT